MSAPHSDSPHLPHKHSSCEAAAGCCGHAHAPPAPVALPLGLAPLEQALATQAGVQTPIRILQMDCPTEEALLRKKLASLPGVNALEFNLMQRVLTVTHEPQVLESILAAVRSLGLTPELGAAPAVSTAAPPDAASSWRPLALAGAAALGAELAHGLGGPAALGAGLALLAVLLCGTSTYQKGWVALRNGSLNINALMSLAVTGALLIGQWPEAAMVMVLFALAERIEAKSLDRARQAIQGLLQLAPERASVLQADGTWQDEAASAVLVGARVRVKPGERIALDGTLLSGHSTVNQAPITGESLPVDKAPGDAVFAGTLNGAGAFEYRVSATAGHSTLARILHAVEAAQSARAPTQRWVDTFARRYTPVVCALALAVAVLPPLLGGGLWLEWVYKALVLLVIACPCALVISTPVTIVSGLTAAARQGILVKGGAYLELGRKLVWLALDKTGTLTQGQPVQTDFMALTSLEASAARSVAASLAAHSDHPVSCALATAAQQEGVALQPVTQFEALPGRGVQAWVQGKFYRLGNHRLMHEQGLCSAALEQRFSALEAQGKTLVLLADEHSVLALFAVADRVRDSSRQAIAELYALGIQTVMLSGDNAATAQAVAAQVGIAQAQGNLLPQDKLAAIARQIGPAGAVGMVGDGINDAPALARADIGFAMGAMGTGTAIETADVALMDDDLRKLPQFVRLSHRTHALLMQNIALALGIKAVFLALTLAGWGTMWMAVFADVGTSLLVVANGLRLLRRG